MALYGQDVTDQLTCFADSDWASCPTTRRSTSGGVLMRGAHLLHHWSRTQATVALSSGEAELNSALKGASEGMGLKSLLAELGEAVHLTLYGDSTASRGILLREGAGEIKHLHVKQLWLQEKVAAGEVSVKQLPRADNVSDALTHHWSSEAAGHYATMGLRRIYI